MTPRAIPDTSLEAHQHLDAQTEDAWLRRALPLLKAQPDTALRLAARLGESYHEVERRCSRGLRKGYLERGDKDKNPSGRTAYRLRPSPAGMIWFRGGPRPDPIQDARDAEAGVLRWARALAATPDATPDFTARLQLLREAVVAYEHALDPLEAQAEARRRDLARMGIWLRSDGTTVPIHDMMEHHLLGALRRRRRLHLDRGPAWEALARDAVQRGIQVPLDGGHEAD